MPQQRSDSRLGSGLRKARREARMIQGALAAAARCSARSVWQAERGQGHAALLLGILAVLDHEVTGRSLPPGAGLGDRLGTLRRRLGASLREVAAKAGVSPNTVSAIERGDLGHLAAVERVAEALGAGLTVAPVGSAPAFFATAALSSAKETWETPPDLLERLYAALGGRFDLDPCSPGPLRSRVQAASHLTEADDGLAHEWRGRVYMNPPYGRAMPAWTAKARSEVQAGRAEFVVGLVPARTDTRWWHADVAGHAGVWLLRGRLAFGDGTNSAPFPSAVLLWGGSPALVDALTRGFPDAQHVPMSARGDLAAA